MDGGAWGATVHGVARNRTRLSDSDPITVKTSASSLSQCFPPRSLKKGQTLFPAVSGVPAPVGERQEAGLASCLSPGG